MPTVINRPPTMNTMYGITPYEDPRDPNKGGPLTGQNPPIRPPEPNPPMVKPGTQFVDDTPVQNPVNPVAQSRMGSYMDQMMADKRRRAMQQWMANRRLPANVGTEPGPNAQMPMQQLNLGGAANPTAGGFTPNNLGNGGYGPAQPAGQVSSSYASGAPGVSADQFRPRTPARGTTYF